MNSQAAGPKRFRIAARILPAYGGQSRERGSPLPSAIALPGIHDCPAPTVSGRFRVRQASAQEASYLLHLSNLRELNVTETYTAARLEPSSVDLELAHPRPSSLVLPANGPSRSFSSASYRTRRIHCSLI